MIDHVTIRVSEPAEAERFYDTVLPTVGIRKASGCFGEGCPEFAVWGQFSIAEAREQPTTGLHVAFSAASREEVDRFWSAGVDAGYESDGEPGPRPQYAPDYYGGFLLDPDGNSVEAVHFADAAARGQIDHLWIRVADLDAARAFYETIAPFSGFDPRHHGHNPERFHFRGPAGSGFALVAEQPYTRGLHWAFRSDDNATVDAFHAAAAAAGHRDNGAPGERPRYHAGYYAAFVLDPAGANVEVVNHNRSS